MTLRLGSVRPLYTLARSMAFRVDNAAANAAGNWEVRCDTSLPQLKSRKHQHLSISPSLQATFTGSPIVADWRINNLTPNCFTDPDACDPATVTADTRRRMWLGQTDNMHGSWDDSSKNMFGGMYIASNAQYVQKVVESGK